MKKVISVILCAVMLSGMFACLAYAADGYTTIHKVSVYSEDRSKFYLAYPVDYNPKTYDYLTPEQQADIDSKVVYKTYSNGEYKLDGTGHKIVDYYLAIPENELYIPDGGELSFRLQFSNSYAIDETTVIKWAPTNASAQILSNDEYYNNDRIFDDYSQKTDEEKAADDDFYVKTRDAQFYIDVRYDDSDMPITLNDNEYPSERIYTLKNVDSDVYIYSALLQEKGLSEVKSFLYNFAKFFRDLISWFFGLFN